MESLGDGPGKLVEDTSSKFNAVQSRPNEVQISPKSPAEQMLAGKFKTAADLEKAYIELQKKLGAPEATPEKKPEAAAKPDDQSPQKMDTGKADETPAPKEGDQEAAAEGKTEGDQPLDFSVYSNEFFEKGELSEASYAKLAKSGLDKGVVDTFIEGQKAIQQVRGSALYEAAGGKDAYNALVAYGSKSLTEAEQASFNKAIDIAITTGDSTAASLLIAGIKAKMGGGEPSYVATQNKNGAPAVEPFASRSDLTKAMRDPRYRTDGDYVRDVQERLRVSNI